jgi:hypothetical protein
MKRTGEISYKSGPEIADSLERFVSRLKTVWMYDFCVRREYAGPRRVMMHERRMKLTSIDGDEGRWRDDGCGDPDDTMQDTAFEGEHT